MIAAPYFCSLYLPLLLFAHPSPLKHHRLKSQSRQETPLIAIPPFFLTRPQKRAGEKAGKAPECAVEGVAGH